MEQNEITEQLVDRSVNIRDTSTGASSPRNDPTKTGVSPQTDAGSCPTCGSGVTSTPTSYVYALGRIGARFPRVSVEKEFAQATGRADTIRFTDRQVLHKILTDSQNRYLVRQLCWVFTVEGLETYILVPRDSGDFDLLVQALRPAPRSTDVDVVVGVRGPIAPPEMCNGLMVPIVVFDQIYSFDIDSLIKAIPRPKQMAAKDFTPAAEELFTRIMQMTDNAGSTDDHRALNYCAVRYQAIYGTVAEAFGRNSSLTAVEVRPSSLSGTRKIVEVIFSFTNRGTGVIERYFTRVDVTEEFPFLVTQMSPFFER